MNFYSQASQDRFVYELLVKDGLHTGTFLDIGCGGLEISNTRGLEEIGWRGWLVDINPSDEPRLSTVIKGDATKMNWDFLPDNIDYLSLDIDQQTLAALHTLPLHRVKFQVITCEDDSYRFGQTLRLHEHAYLGAAGYELICDDVHGQVGFPFESWWVSKELLPKAEKFRCKGKLHSDIFK